MEIPAGEEVAPPPGPCPWLVFDGGEGYKTQTFWCNITGPPSRVKTYQKRIPVLQNKQVVSCSHGMLVLYDVDTKQLSLCNSTTFGDTIVLPTLHHLSNYRIDTCLLHPNWSDSFMVLLFLEGFPSIMCCRVGFEHEWSEIAYGERLYACFPQGLVERVEPRQGPLWLGGAAICGSKIIAKLRSKRGVSAPITWCIEIVVEKEERLGMLLSMVCMLECTTRGLHVPVKVYLLES
ncbi:unnamed protein product [Cuscuta campestris]|uniref:KIB1-4 beta-propeller domain-containing protein n=1 Tax=Cuscuta campestris TaxID=132261 RepID=A0A484M8C2_9ASTE|nr:unnamed protein product [Cuscuta campestris]VFQ84306.1 unnamed protein product [Cuscuta campestris]